MIYTVVGGDLYRLKCGLVEQLPSGEWAAIVPCRIWNQPMGSPGVTGGFRTREAAAPEAPALGQIAGPALLSERERDVLTGVGKGFSYAEVADALKITTNTVRTHVRKIYEKLSVNSRAEALYEYNRRMTERGQPPIR